MYKTHQTFFHIGYQKTGTAVVKQRPDLLHRKFVFKYTINLGTYLSFWSKFARIVVWNTHGTSLFIFLSPILIIESEWILNFCQKHHDIFGKLSIWLLLKIINMTASAFKQDKCIQFSELFLFIMENWRKGPIVEFQAF